MVEGLPRSEGHLKIGEMPQPRYITGPEGLPWIGIEAFSTDGQIRKFLWHHNLPKDTKNHRDNHSNYDWTRFKLAEHVATLELGGPNNTKVAVGPSISLRRSDPETRTIRVFENPPRVGIYIEAAKREGYIGLNLFMDLPSEWEVRNSNQQIFDKLMVSALAVMPYQGSVLDLEEFRRSRSIEDNFEGNWKG